MELCRPRRAAEDEQICGGGEQTAEEWFRVLQDVVL